MQNCNDLLGLSFVSLSKKVCRRSPVSCYKTDSYASRSKSRCIGKTACRVATQLKSHGSVAGTVLYFFLREAAKQKVVHGLVLGAPQHLSCKLLCFGASPSVNAVTWKNLVHNVLLERVWAPRSSCLERALVNAPWKMCLGECALVNTPW